MATHSFNYTVIKCNTIVFQRKRLLLIWICGCLWSHEYSLVILSNLPQCSQSSSCDKHLPLWSTCKCKLPVCAYHSMDSEFHCQSNQEKPRAVQTIWYLDYAVRMRHHKLWIIFNLGKYKFHHCDVCLISYLDSQNIDPCLYNTLEKLGSPTCNSVYNPTSIISLININLSFSCIKVDINLTNGF